MQYLARGLPDFSVKQADTYGIVYTPQEIVDFMVASVEEVLHREFGVSLSTPGVRILDPCTGTGNFMVNILRRVARSALEQKYRHDLFCNEIMLLPYYIAALNIEHAYYALAGHYLPFEGLCFTDTLELAEGQQMNLFVEAKTARVERQKAAEITVIIGNPPYNVGQQNENDNNKNRSYAVIDKRIRETYAKDSKATLNTKLYDAYVKFFRWATDRLGDRDGIVCFVSNNSFVDQLAFDGMRQHLLQDFTHLYHFDLHGNVSKNPKLSGTTHNVFGIQVGVGITVAVRRQQQAERGLHYYRVPEDWRKTEKLAFLAEKKSLAGIEWQELQPDDKQTWLTEGMQPDFAAFLPMGTREAKSTSGTEAPTIFKTYSLGVSTNRDSVVYDFDQQVLAARVTQFIEDYRLEVARWVIAGRPSNVDTFVRYEKVKWSRNLKRDLRNERLVQFDNQAIRRSLYRPFTSMWLYNADVVVDERGTTGTFFPTPASEAENVVIVAGGYGRKHFAVLVSNHIPNLNFYADPAQCFPFYTYSEDGATRRENITDWRWGSFGPPMGSR